MTDWGNVQRPKRHHYVPRSYLRRFANMKDQVFLIDRVASRGFTTHIDNVTVESGFNDLLGTDGERHSDAEDALSVLEGQFNTLLDTFIHADEGLEGPNDEQRALLALFISMQFFRTKEVRQTQEELADIYIRAQLMASYGNATIDELRDRLSEIGGHEPADQEVEDLRASLDRLDEFTILPSQNTLIKQMFEHSEQLMPLFAVRPWTLLRARKKVFVTSDRPVTLWRRPDGNPYGIGIATADEIYFPLDPCTMLMMGRGDDVGWQVAFPAPALSRAMNLRIARWSHRWIIHDPGHRPLEGESIPATGPGGMSIYGVPLRDKKQAWEVMKKALAPRRNDT